MREKLFRQLFIIAALCLSCASCIAQEPYVRLNGHTFTVEIADSSDKQQLGLMFRDSMPRDHGMLFIFGGEAMRSFWMKNTRIPLDIIYLDSEYRIVSVARGAKPCRTQQCPGYPSKGPAQYVLELNAGMADEVDAKVGDRLEVRL